MSSGVVRFMATVSAGDEALEGWGGQETKLVVGRKYTQ